MKRIIKLFLSGLLCCSLFGFLTVSVSAQDDLTEEENIEQGLQPEENTEVDDSEEGFDEESESGDEGIDLLNEDNVESTPLGTISFEDFIQAVIAGNGTYDGQGAVVKWEPDEKVSIIHRIQNNNAQYQIFSELQDINISNVSFEYVPADIPQHADGWNNGVNDFTKDQIRNAEFQLLNSGNVTITNCKFEKVIVSPFGPGGSSTNANRTFTFTNCTTSNVYNAYALKDIYTASAVITNNTFNNCSGAIYFEGGIERQSLTITGNTFNTIDRYAASGKENTRAVIQFSASGMQTTNTNLTFSGNTITGNTVDAGLPVVRQLSDLGAVTVNGWTPGEAFSIKMDADQKTLPNMPSNMDYTFKGWAAAELYNGPTDTTHAASFLQAGDAGTNGTMYYAVWEASKYTVTYTDGVEGEEVFADQIFVNVVVGSQTPAFKGTPSRQGYTFKGWTPELSATVTGDVTYTAEWEKQASSDTTEQDKPTDNKQETNKTNGTQTGTSFNTELMLIVGGAALAGVVVLTTLKKTKKM